MGAQFLRESFGDRGAQHGLGVIRDPGAHGYVPFASARCEAMPAFIETGVPFHTPES